MSYINSAQFETYRRNIPSSPLCLRRFFSCKTRFYRYPCASFTLICCGDGAGGKRRERGTETYDEKSPGFGFQKVRRAEKSGCAMLLRPYDIFTGSPDVRHDLYHTPYTLLLERICYLRMYLYQQYRYNILSSYHSASPDIMNQFSTCRLSLIN